jgi:hypothetical protein
MHQHASRSHTGLRDEPFNDVIFRKELRGNAGDDGMRAASHLLLVLRNAHVC